MAQAEIKLYRTRSCPFCIMAAAWFADRDLKVEEIFLDSHPHRRELTSSIKPGHTTVPLIVINGKPLGGLDDLRLAEDRGELEALLGSGS
ncbi:MAG: glutaredoxin family protein [Planctomycetota bacterium]|jgi:glutaredoxin 3